jgi:transposase InsO family protein
LIAKVGRLSRNDAFLSALRDSGIGFVAADLAKANDMPARRRELVDQVRGTWKVSIRWSCQVLGAERSSYHYKGKRRSQAALEQRIKEIAEIRVRYGYRRIHVLLCREGWAVNQKRIYRLYKGFGLKLRKKTPKRRVKAKLQARALPRVVSQLSGTQMSKPTANICSPPLPAWRNLAVTD